MTLVIDLHVLQTVPPSNLNRDDTGSPKTATYGGIRRARVSSQAWKRATRRDFNTYLDRSQVGVRTKRAIELLTERMLSLSPSLPREDAAAQAEAALAKVGLKVKEVRRAKSTGVDPESKQTEYLIFFSNQQLDKLAKLATEAAGNINAREGKAILQGDRSFDVALFGRMVANDADLNVDASCQVAHALSTHAVSNEFDYYTAVDDENPSGETGAGMIGTIEFNSATLYRYATVDVDDLRVNLGDDLATRRAVEAFVRSFTLSMPTGKQNTFANGTLPDAVVAMVRTDRAVSLVGAFEDAVPRGDHGYVQASARKLAQYATDVAETFASPPSETFVVQVGEATKALAAIGERVSMDALVERVGGLVSDYLG